MQRVTLGRSGLDVPVFAVGTAPLADVPEEQGLQVLLRGIQLGATWWDTSDDYGTLPLVGKALAGLPRNRMTISSKLAAKSHDEGVEGVRQALAMLATDYLDIMFLHYVHDADDLAARQGCLEALLEAKAAGRIKAVGLSSHNCDAIKIAAGRPEIDVVLAPWNVHGELPDGGSLFEMEFAIRACYTAGKGVMLMKLLADGALRTILDEAIRAAVRIPYKHAVDIGVQSIHQLETDIRLVLGRPVDARILQQLKEGSGWGKAA